MKLSHHIFNIPDMQPSEEKLGRLRASMKDHGINAYIIPNTNPHLGEYIPDHWRIIAWLTGFTGSAATVVVTDSFAGLWTDSRYLCTSRDTIERIRFCADETYSSREERL